MTSRVPSRAKATRAKPYMCPNHLRVGLRPGRDCPHCGTTFAALRDLSVRASAFRKVGYDRRYLGVAMVARLIET